MRSVFSNHRSRSGTIGAPPGCGPVPANLGQHARRVWSRAGRRVLTVVVAAGFLMLGACAPAEKRPELPAISSPASESWDFGRFVWLDLLTDDTEAASVFYSRLFGWEIAADGNYLRASADGIPFAGMLTVPDRRRKDGGRSRWLASVSVADVDASSSRASDLGGKVLAGPESLGARGRFAVVSDSQGAQLVLLRSAAGDPSFPPATPLGGWLWMELWSRDITAALAFYGELLDYTVVEPGRHDDYRILAQGDLWRASVTTLPEGEAVSAWLPSFRVQDARATARQAEELGGKVLLAPDEPPADGSVAVIADPSGAVFMIQAWDDEDMQQEASQ